MKNIVLEYNLLLILILFPFTISYADQFSKFKNELHTNRLTLRDNAVWIVASKGLVKYDKTAEKVSSVSGELGIRPDIEYLSIASTSDNSLWFASEYYGVIKYDGKMYDYADSYIAEQIGQRYMYAFIEDSDGRVFVGDLDNIFYVDNLTPFDSNKSYYHCLQMYQLSNVADGATGGGFLIMDMEFDSKGNLWIVSDNSNANINDSERELATLIKKSKDGLNEILETTNMFPYSFFDAEPILNFENINATSLVLDKEDNIWFTSEEGIHCYNQISLKDSIMTNATNPNIPATQFYANDTDDIGNIWFSSSTTLMKYDGTDFTTYTCPDYNEARSILCDGDIVWVLLKDDKLLKFQNNEFETIDLTPAVMGISETVIDANKTKAYIANGVLNIEKEEGITSVEVYNSLGTPLFRREAGGEDTSIQIPLPATLNGVIIVNVNNEVVKVICN